MLGESASAASGLVVWALKLSGIWTSCSLPRVSPTVAVLGIDLLRRGLHVHRLLHLRDGQGEIDAHALASHQFSGHLWEIWQIPLWPPETW